MKFKVGQEIRDMGLYPFNCDGIIVSINRWYWQLGTKGWFKQYTQYNIVVKYPNKIKYYDNYTASVLKNYKDD